MKRCAYQIAKEIGAASAVLKGEVDVIVLTGGLAYSKRLLRQALEDTLTGFQMLLCTQVKMNLQALAEGALRVLNEEEAAKRIPE